MKEGLSRVRGAAALLAHDSADGPEQHGHQDSQNGERNGRHLHASRLAHLAHPQRIGFVTPPRNAVPHAIAEPPGRRPITNFDAGLRTHAPPPRPGIPVASRKTRSSSRISSSTPMTPNPRWTSCATISATFASPPP